MSKSAALAGLFLKAEEIRTHADRLSLVPFPSERPKDFALFLSNVCRKLQSLIKQGHFDNVDERVITITTIFLVDEVAPMLRYVEGASSENTPANLVLPMEKIGERIIKGATFIIRRQWHYNYAAVELRSTLEPRLTSLPAKNEWQDVLRKLRTQVYAISFPYLERDNTALHVSLAHEIGHQVAPSYLSKEDETEVLDELHGEIQKMVTTVTTPDRVQRAEEIGRSLTRAYQLRQAALTELLSDTISAHVFGPSVLFALYEIASLSESIDKISFDMHPPWRLRIDHMLDTLDDLGFVNKQSFSLSCWPETASPALREVKSEIDRWLGRLEPIVSDWRDRVEVNKEPSSSSAYISAYRKLADLRKFAAGYFLYPPYSQDMFRKEVPMLLERLQMDLPPNQIEQHLTQTRDVSLASILASVWLYKLTSLPSLFERDPEGYAKRVHTLNRLTLKAIELSEVKREYQEWQRKRGAETRGPTE